jgi:hypothetical protein
MLLHILFISALVDNWVDYLADLHAQVMLLVSLIFGELFQIKPETLLG